MKTIIFFFLFGGIICEKVAIDLPVFDLYQIKDAQGSSVHDDKSVIARMDEAARLYGCFILSNVTKNLLQYSPSTINEAAISLFSLPEQSKASLTFNATNHFGRGYLSFGAESGLSEVFEPKEGYSYGHPGQHEEGKEYGWLTSANLWPSDLSHSSRDVLESVHVDFGHVAKLIVKSLIRYQEETHDKSMQLSVEEGEKISLMRLFHYFAVNTDDVTTATTSTTTKTFLGSSPHTDWGLLTVILQDDTGLQFYHNNDWIDVPNLPDTLIVNIGDYFSLASEGRYRSPIHRVLCPRERDRLSFVYFYYPNFESHLIQQQPQQTQQTTPTNTDDVAPETCSVVGEKEERCKEELHFNTLTVSEEEGVQYSTSEKQRQLPFGEYILYKWRSVLRTQA